MKLFIAILVFLTLASCSPQEILQNEELPPPPTTEQPDTPDPPRNNTMKITIGNTSFSATLVTNTTVTTFKAMLPLTLNMSDFNRNEKVCSLPNSLTTAATNVGTIHTGDIMLYGTNSLVLFYETFPSSYNYTKIGNIDNTTELKAALGSESVTIKFELE